MRDIQQELRKADVLRAAGAASIQTLADQVKIRTARKGSHLFYDKDEVQAVYAVLDGCAALYKMNTQGEKKVIFIFKEGALLNEVILHDMHASINCELLEESRILVIPRTALLEVMEKDFVVCRGIMDSMAMKIRRLYRQMKNTTNAMRGEKKIASKLWKLGRDYGVSTEKGMLIDMDMSITYLADMLGSKRETVSRQLKVLTGEGLIRMEKNRFYIIDDEELRMFCERS